MIRIITAMAILGAMFLGSNYSQQFRYVRQCDGNTCRLVAVPISPPTVSAADVTPSAGTVVYASSTIPQASVTYSGGSAGQAAYAGGSSGQMSAGYGYTSPYNGVTYRSRFAARRPVLAGAARTVGFVGRVAVRAPFAVARRVVFGRRR